MVTGYGACLDFCDDDNALFVPATVAPVEMPDVGPSSIGYWWAEPDATRSGRICWRGRRPARDPRRPRGGGPQRIVSDFTWDMAAGLAAER